MNRVQKRQNSKTKNIINMSWFPHLETRSLNHLLTRNLKILNLNGHLSECSSACIFGISTGIKKKQILEIALSLTGSESCNGECYITIQK